MVEASAGWTIYFETVFAISLILNFFVEYYHDGSTIPTREMKKIAIRYLKGGFFLDFLPLIPFASFIDLKENREMYFHMIKIIRLVKCEEIFNVSKLMVAYKELQKKRIETIIKNDPYKGEDVDSDLINITKLILVGQVMSMIRLILIIVNICYFMGFIQILLFDITAEITEEVIVGKTEEELSK